MARIARLSILVLISLGLLAATPAPQVEVTFVDPDKFVDIGTPPISDRMLAQVLGELRGHLVKQASPRLAAGQKFAVTITDVDLAGDFERLRSPTTRWMRVYRDVYPPRIALTFRLTGADGTLIAEGQRTLSDTAYLNNPGSRSDPLRREKRLLGDWLAREFPSSNARP